MIGGENLLLHLIFLCSDISLSSHDFYKVEVDLAVSFLEDIAEFKRSVSFLLLSRCKDQLLIVFEQIQYTLRSYLHVPLVL